MKHKLIFRLDDACPQMNIENWGRIEELLDKYGIKPIVGVIPDNKDTSFGDGFYDLFWEKVIQWKNKGWTIAQHGLNHSLIITDTSKCFQRVIEKETEFVGKTFDEQRRMLCDGYSIMKQNKCEPSCFFAPCHTFDVNTVNVIRELGFYSFISDGYAFHAYKKNGVVFIPAMFDSPHVLWGVQTFIAHPNNMTNDDFDNIESFLHIKQESFITPSELLSNKKRIKKQGFIGKLFEIAIYYIRKNR